MLGTLFLVLLLNGCVQTDKIAKPKIIYISPPETLMTPCSKPNLQGETWADLVEHTIRLADELTVCNERILAIRRYVKTQSEDLTKQSGNDKERSKNRDRPEPRGHGNPGDNGKGGPRR